MRGGMFGMGGPPPAKSKNFSRSFGRLIGRLRPEAPLIVAVLVFAIGSVTFAVLGPKILGQAVNIIFEGAVSKQLPPGVTQDQAVSALRLQGQTQQADMLAAMHLTPGAGIDFAALAQILLVLTGLYLLSSLFGWIQAWIMAGVTQRTVYRLRQDVDRKLARLPLSYFDGHPRGDLLSRVTNDIDNIGQSLQQSLTQLITSLLTIVGTLIIMLTISPTLAVISLLAVPASIVLMIIIVSRSQKQFIAQWASTGSLNGHVEEMHTGHAIVKVFGRQREAVARFDEENEKLYEASYRAQFISGLIQPSMSFISNLNYVAHLRDRRPPGRERPAEPRRRDGIHPVLPPVHVPDHPDGQHRQRPPVGGRVGGARLRAAGRSGRATRPGGAAGARAGARRRCVP